MYDSDQYIIYSSREIFSKYTKKLLSGDIVSIGGNNYKRRDIVAAAFLGLDYKDPYVMYKDKHVRSCALYNIEVEDLSDIEGEGWKPIETFYNNGNW